MTTAPTEVALNHVKRVVRNMSAAHTMVLALHGPADKDCHICEWLRLTERTIKELEGEVAQWLGGEQPKLGNAAPPPVADVAIPGMSHYDSRNHVETLETALQREEDQQAEHLAEYRGVGDPATRSRPTLEGIEE